MNTQTSIGQEITPDKYVNVMPCMRDWAMQRGIHPARGGEAGYDVTENDRQLVKKYRQDKSI